MNRKSIFLTALVAGLLPVAALAQVSPTPPASSAPAAPAAAAQQAPPPPQAVPAKIAIISFEQAVVATNEGQTRMQEVQKKYEPKQTQLETLNNEIESLKKQLQAAPASLSEEERASRLKTIDTKEKQLQRDSEDARTAYQSDLQEAYGKVAQKFAVVMNKYVADNGYTILLNGGAEQSPIMWIAQTPNTDVSLAVIAAYNTSSGVSAPPPTAPSASRPKPAGASTAPRTATPKPQAK